MQVFVTGGTGHMGSRLISMLLERGHGVTALARQRSERKLPSGCVPVLGNALDGDSYVQSIGACDTFVQLVGVAHPSPAKAREFVEIDQKSAMEAIRAAAEARLAHFVYVAWPILHP
jgi:nucleoside-diphosphate-sugar epimerase